MLGEVLFVRKDIKKSVYEGEEDAMTDPKDLALSCTACYTGAVFHPNGFYSSYDTEQIDFMLYTRGKTVFFNNVNCYAFFSFIFLIVGSFF